MNLQMFVQVFTRLYRSEVIIIHPIEGHNSFLAACESFSFDPGVGPLMPREPL